jgi:hypothetical protein
MKQLAMILLGADLCVVRLLQVMLTGPLTRLKGKRGGDREVQANDLSAEVDSDCNHSKKKEDIFLFCDR